MADLQWPEGLPTPTISGFGRTEMIGFRENDLATGPAFREYFSDDLPIFYQVSFVMKRGDARRFQLWLRDNKVCTFSPWFDVALPVEDNTSQVQECRFTADGYPQLQGTSSGGVFTYSGTLISRELINNDDDYSEEIDAMWGTNNGDIGLGSSLLDEGLNG